MTANDLANEQALTQLALLRLRQEFAPNQVNTLPKPYSKDSPKGNCGVCGGYHGLPALHLSYVGHAALTDRFLEVDPFWSWEPVAFDVAGLPAFDKQGGLWIRLTICGVTRLGYGDAQGKTGNNAVKEAIGDALRNAGMRFGAALDLWHKGDLHDATEERGEQAPPVEPQESEFAAFEDSEPYRAKLEAATTSADLDVVAAELTKANLHPADLANLKVLGRTRRSELSPKAVPA